MPEAVPHILVVEDEKGIRELMALLLLRQGYKVSECASAEESITLLEDQKFSLVVLDWMLPGMVTAKTEPQDIVEGLEKGADDYLTKPFDPGIFTARVKALLRRAQAMREKEPQKIVLGELIINFSGHEVFVKNEKLHLTPSEYKLLTAMVQNRGKVLTRDSLIENIQGEGITVIGRTVDTHVFGLRKKLGEWSDNIETIRGVGYRVKVD
jgi:two-component system, OmpR family, phosphate regulon response regulator PhoB